MADVSLTGSPFDRLTLSGSFFQYRDLQDFGLIRATERRFEDPDGVDFYTDTPVDYRSTLTTVAFGGSLQIAERTDASLAYSFTRSDSRFQADTPTSSTIRSPSRVRSDIHGVETRVGRWVRDGLRVFVGYRFDRYLDHTDIPNGIGSVVAPFDLSTYQHTGTIGITLTSDLLARN